MFERHDVWGEVFHESVGVWVGCSGGKPEEKEEILSRKIRGEGRGLCLKYIYGSSMSEKVMESVVFSSKSLSSSTEEEISI